MPYFRANRSLIVMLLLLCTVLFTSCSGYQLIISDATVTGLDATHVYYRVTVKNARQSGSCKSETFYGYFGIQAYLTDKPNLENATIRDAAGGFDQEFMIPPQDTPGRKRTVAIGQEYPKDFDGGLDADFSIERTPYIIFTLYSSTESPFSAKTGTNKCTRYGNHVVIDLREIDFD